VSQSNEDLVRGIYAAFGRADVPALLEMLDEQIEWHAPPNVPQGGDFHGREAVGGFFEAIGENWESLEVDVEALVAGGDRVVALVGLRGRLRASGEEAVYSSAHAWTIVDGIPVRFDEYVNAPLTLPAAHALTG
jgi:hypothetical protein